ncbi:MAG TPA: GTP 3',8-cyclase MoaA, partial [Psychrobacter sp.]|nr:GTP 3',8-cyclase MoaA [Psychrobacter sp.]
MNHLAPTVGNAQLYSPTAAPTFFDGHSPSKLAVLSTHSAVTLFQPLTDGFARRLTYLRLSITD